MFSGISHYLNIFGADQTAARPIAGPAVPVTLFAVTHNDTRVERRSDNKVHIEGLDVDTLVPLDSMFLYGSVVMYRRSVWVDNQQLIRDGSPVRAGEAQPRPNIYHRVSGRSTQGPATPSAPPPPRVSSQGIGEGPELAPPPYTQRVDEATTAEVVAAMARHTHSEDILAALTAMVPYMGTQSVDDLLCIMNVFGSDFYRVDVVKLLANKTSSPSTGDLTKLLNKIGGDSNRLSVIRVLRRRMAEFTPSDVLAVLKAIRSDISRIDGVRLLAPQLSERPPPSDRAMILSVFVCDGNRNEAAAHLDKAVKHFDAAPGTSMH